MASRMHVDPSVGSTRTRTGRGRRRARVAGVAAAVVLLVAACCPAPLATDASAARPESAVLGIVDGRGPARSWITTRDGLRIAVHPPLDLAAGTRVYLRGWVDPDGSLEVRSVQALADDAD